MKFKWNHDGIMISFMVYSFICSILFGSNNLFSTSDKANDHNIIINPLTSPGEGVTVFTYPYLSAGDPAQGEAKGLITS